MEKEESGLFDFYKISEYRSILMGIAMIFVIFHHLTIRTYDGIFGKIYSVLRLNGGSGVDIFRPCKIFCI